MKVAPLPQILVLNIPAEQYYAYERFFILPSGLAGTILAAGVIRLIARWWKGQGHFEDLFALLGFSMIVVAVALSGNGMERPALRAATDAKTVRPRRWR